MKQHVVVMFEPAMPGKQLSLTEKVSQVFGPFKDVEVAMEWLGWVSSEIPGRMWLVLPLDNPDAVMEVQ